MKPTNMGTGLVIGQFGMGVVDGPDEDQEPEVIPLSGSITFTPSVPYLPNHSAQPNPITIVTAPIRGVIDSEGYLCTPEDDGVTPRYRGVRLFATDDPDMSVQNWTYSVTYRFNVINGATPSMKAHAMSLPEGSEMDLTQVVEVPSSPGVGTPQALALLALAEAAATDAALSASGATAIALQVKADADAGLFDGKPGEPGDASPITIAAAEAAADARIDERDILTGPDVRSPGRGDYYDPVLVGVGDVNHRRAWTGVSLVDGGPDAWAEYMLRERLGIRIDPDGDVLWAVTDTAGRHTDLELDMVDGAVTDRVMDRWAPRIAERIGAGGGGGFAAGDRVMDPGGGLVRVVPDMKNVYGWGSSSMQVIASAMTAALSGTGAVFHGEGRSGERSEETFARFGSRPALLSVSGGGIPASGPVTVTASNMASTSNLKPFTGTLLGVPGTLAWSGGELAFTRTTLGDALTVPAETPFIPDLGAPARVSLAFLWAGKNNMRTAGASSQVIAQTDQAFDWFTPLVKRVLVIGHFVDSDQASGSVQYQNVAATNTAHAARYGDLFVDVRGYLASSQLWTDTGITPTSTDLSQQASGLKPESVSIDVAHLNAAGNTAVANFIRTHLTALGWY